MGSNHLQPLADTRHDHVLDAGVEVFGVLPHDDEIDVLIARRDTVDAPNRPQIGVQVELFSERDVGAGKAFAHQRCQRPFQGDLVVTDRLQELLGKRVAGLLEGANPRFVTLPDELHSGGIEHLHSGIGNLGTDPVTRD